VKLFKKRANCEDGDEPFLEATEANDQEALNAAVERSEREQLKEAVCPASAGDSRIFFVGC